MKSDPFDVVGCYHTLYATLRKMHQNLFWAVAYNVAAFRLRQAYSIPLQLSQKWRRLRCQKYSFGCDQCVLLNGPV